MNSRQLTKRATADAKFNALSQAILKQVTDAYGDEFAAVSLVLATSDDGNLAVQQAFQADAGTEGVLDVIADEFCVLVRQAVTETAAKLAALDSATQSTGIA